MDLTGKSVANEIASKFFPQKNTNMERITYSLELLRENFSPDRMCSVMFFTDASRQVS